MAATADTSASNSRAPLSGGAAREKLGRKPAARIRRQRELRHQQQRASDVANAAIHLAGRIGEYSVGHEPRRELFGLCGPIIALDSDQHEQSNPNFGYFNAVYRYARPTYSLNQPDQPKTLQNHDS